MEELGGTPKIIEEIFEYNPRLYVDVVLTREYYSVLGDLSIKELRLFANRKRENIYILDHSLTTWPYDLDRIIPLPPFENIGLLDVIAQKLKILLQVELSAQEKGEKRYVGVDMEKGAQSIINRIMRIL